jgi:hypothetical protein
MVSKYEVKAKKDLEKEGWKVDDKRGMSRWSKNRDFWNLFDLVAIKQGEPMRWISIKGTQGLLKQLKAEIEAFWMPKGNIKELWCRAKVPGRLIIWNKWVCSV